jgi:tryptophan synthase alpha chain
MSRIRKKIEEVNNKNEKVLSVFLTAGYPERENFVDLALGVLDAGANMLEIGIPFSDPLADGRVIQQSSNVAIANGVNLDIVLKFTRQIRAGSDKPLILMGYANPVFRYGVKRFLDQAVESGVDGLIIPDVPLDEYDSFYPSDRLSPEKILLTTPQSGEERIKLIDSKSSGFVYCVSVSGTTGVRSSFTNEQIKSLGNTRNLFKNNKMFIGFGISTVESIKQVSPFCDGVIVGSAVIKKIDESGVSGAIELVKTLKEGCRN